MNEANANPFAAPEVADAAVSAPPGSLADYSFDQLKKLYYRSCNVAGIGLLLGIATLIIGFALTFAGRELAHEGMGGAFTAIMGGVLVLYLITVVGVFMRSNWGRVMGIIACAFMLLRIPIGTIIGIMGLVAFIKAKELFGPDRITHAEVKRAFKQAKRERKQARRG